MKIRLKKNNKQIAARMFKNPLYQTIFLILLIIGSSVAAFYAIITPSPLTPSTANLVVGAVAQQDIVAPRSISYESTILTEQQREAAVKSVLPVYAPVDPSIARQQVAQLRDTIAYITSVREDSYATQEQKLEDMAAMQNVRLSPETMQAILALSNARWQVVQQEAVNVLEQVMRNTIRDYQLEDVRRSIPAMVSLSLPEDQADIVADLVTAFVLPNSFISETLTESARQQARENIKPVIRSFAAGETIISRGRLIKDIDLEALQKLGIAKPQKSWQDYLSAASISILMILFSALYLQRVFIPQNPRVLGKRALAVLTILFLAFLYTARFAIPGDDFVSAMMPYIIPLSAYSLTLAALFGSNLALIFILPLVILVTYGLPRGFEIALYHIIGSMLGVFYLGKAQRIFSFLAASAISAGSGFVIAFAFRMLEVSAVSNYPIFNPAFQRTLIILSIAAIVNCVSSAGLTIALQFFLAQILGLVSPLHLVELTRPDHPLLRLLMQQAPGSYQHSLQVGNLAEQASERVNADGLLARVGALYHDIGKTRNPAYFIENQLPGQRNPHEDLTPTESAAIIISHVTEGLKLGRKYRLPRRVLQFIVEHHGNSLARYQYVQAVKAVGNNEQLVNEADFRYPGNPPTSRESGIVMLADGCEAATRAKRPTNEAELREIVENIIESRLKDHQLEYTDITFNDLTVIKETFIEVLKGIYHPRIDYPILEKPSETITALDDTIKIPRREVIPESLAALSPSKDLEIMR